MEFTRRFLPLGKFQRHVLFTACPVLSKRWPKASSPCGGKDMQDHVADRIFRTCWRTEPVQVIAAIPVGWEASAAILELLRTELPSGWLVLAFLERMVVRHGQ